MNYAQLNSAVFNDILDVHTITQIIEMAEKRQYLERHRFKIYQGSGGSWITYVHPDGKERKRIQRKSRRDLEEALFIFYKDLDENPTIEELFNEWQQRRLEIKKIKAATFTRNEQIFSRHFVEFGGAKIKSVTSDMVCDFLEEQLTKHNLTSQAFSNLKSIVRGVLKRAKRQKLIYFNVDMVLSEVDVSDRDFKPRIIDDSKEIFYDDEYDLVLEYCYINRKELRNLGVALMLVSGLRVGELVALRRIDISDGIVKVHRTETRYKMNGHYCWDVSEYPKTPAGVRQVVIADTFKWILDGLLQIGGDEFIFVGRKGNRLHTQAIYKQMKRICSELGIPGRSPHKARKTYGSILLDNHVDNKTIEKQMGHTDILTTEAHYHRDRKRLDKKKEIINSIPEFNRSFE